MKVLLLRHAYAGHYIGSRDVDDKRDLEPEGIDAAKAMAAWMADPKRAKKMLPNSIACSPLPRAVQTAKIMAGAFGMVFKIDPNLEISKPMEMVIKNYCDDASVSRPLLIAHGDNIVPGLARLNFVDKWEVDPLAMAELRVLRVDRDTSTWDERLRVLPSDLGETDFY